MTSNKNKDADVIFIQVVQLNVGIETLTLLHQIHSWGGIDNISSK
jgi:hypothetical protein